MAIVTDKSKRFKIIFHLIISLIIYLGICKSISQYYNVEKYFSYKIREVDNKNQNKIRDFFSKNKFDADTSFKGFDIFEKCDQFIGKEIKIKLNLNLISQQTVIFSNGAENTKVIVVNLLDSYSETVENGISKKDNVKLVDFDVYKIILGLYPLKEYIVIWRVGNIKGVCSFMLTDVQL